MLCQLGKAVVHGGAEGLDDLPVLVVGKADGAVARPLPGFVGGDGLAAAVRIGELQLRKELGFGSVLVFQAPGPAGATIPAVGKLHRQLVFAGMEQLGHVIGLVLDPFAVIRVARRQRIPAHFFSIQPCFIQPAGGDIKPCLPGRLRHGEDFAEAIHGAALLFVDRVGSGDPLRRPDGDAPLKEGLAPFPRGVAFIPEANFPSHPLPVVEPLGVLGPHGA